MTFVDAALGSDDALAARIASTENRRGTRILVLGGSRPALLTGLAERGFEVIALDSSRTALRRTQATLAEESGDTPITLLADDPREMTIPSGVDLALITSAVWRAVLLPTDRRHVLRSIARSLREGGRLFIEVERLPEILPSEPTPITVSSTASSAASSPDDAMWWHDPRDPEGTLRVQVGTHALGGTGDDAVLFAAFPLAAALDEIRGSGFGTPVAHELQRNGTVDAETGYAWVVAPVAGGSA